MRLLEFVAGWGQVIYCGVQVNLASILEGLCNPGGILVSHSTYANIADEISCKKRGKIQVKGIHREILVYDVVID